MRAAALFLGLIGLGFAGIILLGYPAWLLVSPHFNEPFSRIASRVGMLVVTVGFVFVARHTKVSDRQSLGYGLPSREFTREVVVAFLLGTLLMLPAIGTMLLFGIRTLEPGIALEIPDLLVFVSIGISSGLVIAFIEETFLRGAMQAAITRESGAAFAIGITSLLYAAFHFVSGKYRVAPQDLGFGSGLQMLGVVLKGFTEPARIVDSFLCLMAVGVLLGMVRALTGNIAACIGLHAGWVMVIYVLRKITLPNPDSPAAWLLGDYDGFIGWMVLAWTPLIGWILYLWYGRRK
jgi:membrane protease YdiL (CAAX protease family)